MNDLVPDAWKAELDRLRGKFKATPVAVLIDGTTALFGEVVAITAQGVVEDSIINQAIAVRHSDKALDAMREARLLKMALQDRLSLQTRAPHVFCRYSSILINFQPLKK